jgi:hypothetical protein
MTNPEDDELKQFEDEDEVDDDVDDIETTADEGACSAREDGVHCVHWWDGEPCCSCGHDGGEVDGEDEDDGEAEEAQATG